MTNSTPLKVARLYAKADSNLVTEYSKQHAVATKFGQIEFVDNPTDLSKTPLILIFLSPDYMNELELGRIKEIDALHSRGYRIIPIWLRSISGLEDYLPEFYKLEGLPHSRGAITDDSRSRDTVYAEVAAGVTGVIKNLLGIR